MCGTDNQPSEGLSCNMVDATGPCVTATTSTDAPPAGLGGTIVVGTYDLTRLTIYPGDSGATDVLTPVRKTIVISGGTSNIYAFEEADASGTYVRRATGVVQASTAAGFTYTEICSMPPDGGIRGPTAEYTASILGGSTLTIIEFHGAGLVTVEVYQQRS
jgi:hypothetical protein